MSFLREPNRMLSWCPLALCSVFPQKKMQLEIKSFPCLSFSQCNNVFHLDYVRTSQVKADT